MTTLPIGMSLALLLGVALILSVPAVRRRVVTRWLMRPAHTMLPRMGDTERIALEAGTVWWDGDLFSGAPDWRKLLDFEVRPLSDRERAFLDGPVQELCTMLDEWTISQAGDLPPTVWDFIKRHRFFEGRPGVAGFRTSGRCGRDASKTS